MLQTYVRVSNQILACILLSSLISSFVIHGSTFVKALSLGSVQMAAYIKSSDLPVLSPSLPDPKPRTRKNETGENVQACVTLSAGKRFTLFYSVLFLISSFQVYHIFQLVI